MSISCKGKYSLKRDTFCSYPVECLLRIINSVSYPQNLLQTLWCGSGIHDSFLNSLSISIYIPITIIITVWMITSGTASVSDITDNNSSYKNKKDMREHNDQGVIFLWLTDDYWMFSTSEEIITLLTAYVTRVIACRSLWNKYINTLIHSNHVQRLIF